MALNANTLCEITESVWVNVLGLEARCGTLAPVGHDEGSLRTCVEITGAWEGKVVLCCPESLGRRVAAIMFGLEEDEWDEEMVDDALCELANMIGGNLKGMLPGPSVLSVPFVVKGPYQEEVRVMLSHGFECDGESFCVAVEEVPDQGKGMTT